MRLKINRWTFDVTNKDWVLDNGACYQCMTLTRRVYDYRSTVFNNMPAMMSKQQFKQLVKENKLIDATEWFHNKYNCYLGCRIWKFNIEEKNNESLCD